MKIVQCNTSELKAWSAKPARKEQGKREQKTGLDLHTLISVWVRPRPSSRKYHTILFWAKFVNEITYKSGRTKSVYETADLGLCRLNMLFRSLSISQRVNCSPHYTNGALNYKTNIIICPISVWVTCVSMWEGSCEIFLSIIAKKSLKTHRKPKTALRIKKKTKPEGQKTPKWKHLMAEHQQLKWERRLDLLVYEHFKDPQYFWRSWADQRFAGINLWCNWKCVRWR